MPQCCTSRDWPCLPDSAASSSSQRHAETRRNPVLHRSVPNKRSHGCHAASGICKNLQEPALLALGCHPFQVPSSASWSLFFDCLTHRHARICRFDRAAPPLSNNIQLRDAHSRFSCRTERHGVCRRRQPVQVKVCEPRPKEEIPRRLATAKAAITFKVRFTC